MSHFNEGWHNQRKHPGQSQWPRHIPDRVPEAMLPKPGRFSFATHPTGKTRRCRQQLHQTHGFGASIYTCPRTTHFNVQLRLAIVLLAAYSRLYSSSIRTWSRRISLKRAARGLATSWPCIVVWTPRQVSWYVPWHFIAPPQRISQNLIPNRSPIVLAFRDISWHIEP